MKNMEHLSVAELAMQAGCNNFAFDELMKRLSGAIEVFLRKHIRDADGAKDIAQDMWMYALLCFRKGSYHERGRLQEWLQTIAFREVIRREKYSHLFVHETVDIAEPDTAAEIMWEERRKLLYSLMPRMEKLPRIVMRSRVERGFSFKKISARTHRSPEHLRKVFERTRDVVRRTWCEKEKKFSLTVTNQS